MESTTNRSAQADARRRRRRRRRRHSADISPAAVQAGAGPAGAGPAGAGLEIDRSSQELIDSSRRPIRTVAAFAYLAAGLLSFLPPLVICLLSGRDEAFLRAHALQAMNAAFTTALYALSSAIVAGLLALDSLRLGLRVGVTAILFCWLVTFGYLVAAAVSAYRGRWYQIPSHLCATFLHS
jgi:uncharacterized Tic20 family protein